MVETRSAATYQRGGIWNTSHRLAQGLLSHIASLVTVRRLTLGLAGTFAFAGAAAALHTVAVDHTTKADTPSSSVQHMQSSASSQAEERSASDSDGATSSSTTSTSFSSTTTDNRTEVQLNIDGHQVAVPATGSSHQVINGPNGSQTTVDSSSTSASGDAVNSSNSSFSLNVTTHSSSSSKEPKGS